MVASKAEVTPNFFTGDGSIGLMAGKPPREVAWSSTPARSASRSSRSPSSATSRPARPRANAQFEVAWEPRLRPMLLKLKTDELKIQDDQGQAVEPQVMKESTEVVLRPDNPAAEINLNLNAPDRAAKSLATLKVKAEITVPAGLRTFRFPTLAVKDAVTQKQGDIAVTLEGTEVDEQVWKVNVVARLPRRRPGLRELPPGPLQQPPLAPEGRRLAVRAQRRLLQHRRPTGASSGSSTSSSMSPASPPITSSSTRPRARC